jgi:DNA-binding beta-propeller fold protein YncE
MMSHVQQQHSGLTHYHILVSSAASATGAVRDGVFRFDAVTGRFLGPFGHGVEISDPRGVRLSPDGTYVVVNNGDNRILTLDAKTGSFIGAWPLVEDLDPGGGKFGWDGRYYVGSRAQKSLIAFDPSGHRGPSTFLPGGFVAFPRGLAISRAGPLYWASGTNPVTGEGLNTILRFDHAGHLDESFKVADAELSPLDMEMGPNDNVLSASEFPFNHPGAVTTVREYDTQSGHLLRVFDAGKDRHGRRITRMPRGITVGPDGGLYASGADNVVRYDLATGRFDRVILESADIRIQSIIFIPR